MERNQQRLKTNSTASASRNSPNCEPESPLQLRHRRKNSNNGLSYTHTLTPTSKHKNNKAGSLNLDYEDLSSERKQSIHDILEIDELPTLTDEGSPPLRPDRKRKRRSTREHILGSIFKGLHMGTNESTEKITFTNKSASKEDLDFIVGCLRVHSIFFFSKFRRCKTL